MSTINTMAKVDDYCRSFQLFDGTIVNCIIYDTAGLERFDALNLTYYKRADAILLVYDITRKSTFDKVKDFYVKNIKDKCSKDILVLLLGNKTDKENEREVTYEEGFAVASKENYEFKESSCLQNKNVAGAFESLIERWNVENHKMLRNITRKISRVDCRNNSSLFDLDKEMIRFNTERTRSQSLKVGHKERKNTIKLKNDKSVNSPKKKKCCSKS